MGKGHLWEEHVALTARGRGSLMVGAWMRRNCQQRSCKTRYHNWAVPFLHRLLCLDTLGMGGIAGRWPQPRNPQIPPKVKTQLHNKERHLKEPRVNLTYCLRDHQAGEREREQGFWKENSELLFNERWVHDIIQHPRDEWSPADSRTTAWPQERGGG